MKNILYSMLQAFICMYIDVSIKLTYNKYAIWIRPLLHKR